MNGIEKINLTSKDLVVDRIKQVKALFPEIVTESAGGGASLKQSISRSCDSSWEMKWMRGWSVTRSPGLARPMQYDRRKLHQPQLCGLMRNPA